MIKMNIDKLIEKYLTESNIEDKLINDISICMEKVKKLEREIQGLIKRGKSLSGSISIAQTKLNNGILMGALMELNAGIDIEGDIT